MILLFFACQQPPTHTTKPLYDMNLVLVESGSFMMGGNTATAPHLHPVNITQPFWLADIEVSQYTYTKIMGDNPSTIVDEQLPVANLTWLQAVQFCNALSKHEGLQLCYTIDGQKSAEIYPCNGYRLPSEAEWEYAAKAGKQYEYAGHITPRYVAWFKEDGAKPRPGRKKKSNPWGLYDMSGNVAEWVFDGYSPYPTELRVDPRWKSPSANRISRGGAWNSYAMDFPVSTRSIDGFDWAFPWVGMRIAQSYFPEAQE